MFDADKTRMIGLPYGEKLLQYVKPFSSDTGTLRTDRRTGRIVVSTSRVSVLTRDKNFVGLPLMTYSASNNGVTLKSGLIGRSR